MLVNTHYFQEEALRFNKEGSYCRYPRGSYAYKEYWYEQDRRCKQGYSVGGLWIPGTYYFYLNFFPILLKDEVTGRKSRNFPRFIDVDLEYFNIVERARKEKKGIILVKPRRQGFSFKHACLTDHEYNFFPEAKCIIGAFDKKYSTNTMNMALDGLNFLDKHTEWFKQRNPDTREHVKAAYKVIEDGKEVWKGSNSEIRVLTFKDNPFASVGQTASMFLFEEGGTFENIIQSYNISEPCWKDGDDMVGLPCIYGTGGDMEGGTVQFAEMFYEPEKYNLLSFPNIWDENKSHMYCGWFTPASKMRFGDYKDVTGKFKEYNGVPMVDKDGNSIQTLGEQSVRDLWDAKKKGSDEQAYRDAVSQYPLCPAQAFLRSKNVIFPEADLRERLSQIETNQTFLDSSYKGELILLDTGKVELRPVLNRTPIRNFPLRPDDISQIQGIIEIWEKPIVDEFGNIPVDRFGLFLDPVDNDDNSTIKNSLQSCFVFDFYTDRIVAEYTGRTKDVKTYYENVRRLALYYGAKITYENNKKGFFGYMYSMNAVWMLTDVPYHLKDSELIKSSTVGNKSKGVPMDSPAMKAYGERLLNSFLLSQAHGLGDGVCNCYALPSVALLKELVAYERDLNTDRVSSLMVGMIEREQRLKYFRNKSIQANVPSFVDDDFFKRRRGNIDKTRAKVEELLFGDKMSFSDSDFFNQ